MAGNAARCAPRAGDPRRVRPAVRRVGRAGRRAGQGRRPATFREPAQRSLQRGHHGRVGSGRAGLGLEDQDLRLPPGESQSGDAGAGRPAAARAAEEDPGPADGHPARRQRGLARGRADRSRPAAAAVRAHGAGAARAARRGRGPRRAAPAAGHPDHARRVAVRIPRRPVAAVERRTADLFNVRFRSAAGFCHHCGSSVWRSVPGWACSSAAIPARRRCFRPRAGTSPAASRVSATSKARTTGTSWPRTSRARI